MGVGVDGDILDGRGKGVLEGMTCNTRFLGFFFFIKAGDGGGCGNKHSGKSESTGPPAEGSEEMTGENPCSLRESK